MPKIPTYPLDHCSRDAQRMLRSRSIFVSKRLVNLICGFVYDQLSIHRSAFVAERSLIQHRRKPRERWARGLENFYTAELLNAHKSGFNPIPDTGRPLRRLDLFDGDELQAVIALEARARDEGDKVAVRALARAIRVLRP